MLVEATLPKLGHFWSIFNWKMNTKKERILNEVLGMLCGSIQT